jgi:hypothetical protein
MQLLVCVTLWPLKNYPLQIFKDSRKQVLNWRLYCRKSIGEGSLEYHLSWSERRRTEKRWLAATKLKLIHQHFSCWNGSFEMFCIEERRPRLWLPKNCLQHGVNCCTRQLSGQWKVILTGEELDCEMSSNTHSGMCFSAWGRNLSGALSIY